jgi:hypothetical protein
MIFLGFVEGNDMDILVQATAGNVVEYYFSLEELYDDCGIGTEFSIIYLEDAEVILNDLSIMRFKDIGMN